MIDYIDIFLIIIKTWSSVQREKGWGHGPGHSLTILKIYPTRNLVFIDIHGGGGFKPRSWYPASILDDD